MKEGEFKYTSDGLDYFQNLTFPPKYKNWIPEIPGSVIFIAPASDVSISIPGGRNHMHTNRY